MSLAREILILAAVLCFAAATRGTEEAPAASPGEKSAGWRLSYAPLVVTQGEPVAIVVRKEGGAKAIFSLESTGENAKAPAATVEEREDGTAVVRFVPPGPGRYRVRGPGFAAAINVTASIRDLDGASASLHHLEGPGGAVHVLYHSRRIIRETRKWYIVRKTMQKMAPAALPKETTVIRPKIGGTSMTAFERAMANSGLPGLKQAEIASDGISPLLSMVLGLARESTLFLYSERSVVLVLPAGEWNGGIAPDDYRRVVEWLLDRFVEAGAKRIAVAGPVGAGTAARVREYCAAAREAATSRMAAYLETGEMAKAENFREAADGPVGDLPVPGVQVRLANELAETLRQSPVIPPAVD